MNNLELNLSIVAPIVISRHQIRGASTITIKDGEISVLPFTHETSNTIYIENPLILIASAAANDQTINSLQTIIKENSQNYLSAINHFLIFENKFSTTDSTEDNSILQIKNHQVTFYHHD